MPIEGIKECPKCGKAPMAQDPDTGDYFCIMCGPKPWDKRHWFWTLVDIACLPISIPLHWVIKGVKFERDLGKLAKAGPRCPVCDPPPRGHAMIGQICDYHMSKLTGLVPCDCPTGRVFIDGTYAGCVACGRGIPDEGRVDWPKHRLETRFLRDAVSRWFDAQEFEKRCTAGVNPPPPGEPLKQYRGWKLDQLAEGVRLFMPRGLWPHPDKWDIDGVIQEMETHGITRRTPVDELMRIGSVSASFVMKLT